MLFKFHFFLTLSAWCASSILLGVYCYEYTDASPSEMGYLFMAMPFISILSRPMIGSAADRNAAHRKYLIMCLVVVALSNVPLVIIPFLGPEVYVDHARICWSLIVLSKTLGDIAMNGAISLGDAITMNYARRLGVEFIVYRVWGSVAWMTMGLVIGQINEVSFLPKYTPGFMILIGSFVLDALLMWLWPEEYFKLVPVNQIKINPEKKRSRFADHLKCLMPKEVILAHMRDKLCAAVCCNKKVSDERRTEGRQHSETDGNKQVEKQTIDKRTQLRILGLLFRRDPRITMYLILFVVQGVLLSPLMFFFTGLAERCQEGLCNFSQLAGMLQFSVAGIATLFFMSTKILKSRFGRLIFCIMSSFLAAFEYSIYAEYWYTMDPYLVVVTNALRGIYYATSVILMSDTAFLFANEVEHLLPELRSKGVINDNSESYNEQLKLSLSATMQAITTASSEGLGRGLGALICGLIIEKSSHSTLWISLGILGACSTIACSSVWIFDKVIKPNIGLDVRAELAKREQAKQMDNQAQSV